MLRGQLELPLDGKVISISGGPFDAMPEGARGLCLEAGAARIGEAEWQLDVPDYGVPDEATLRAILAQMLEAMRAAPNDAYHIGCKAGIVYLGMLPFSVRSYLRLKQEAESLLEPVLVADNGTGKTAP